MARAASQARSACPSCARGAPKSAMIPSPSVRTTVPSKRVTAAHIVARVGCKRSNACSGSSPLMSSVDPTMSANITVACLRSPLALPNEAPQEPQKWAVGEFLCPHFRHATRSRTPQLSQKLLPAEFSVLHAWQRIHALSRSRLILPVFSKKLNRFRNLGFWPPVVGFIGDHFPDAGHGLANCGRTRGPRIQSARKYPTEKQMPARMV
jgi:hypothetical protein